MHTARMNHDQNTYEHHQPLSPLPVVLTGQGSVDPVFSVKL